jgi:non-ribosomal peptide synthetase component F
LIGFFANPLVLRPDLATDPSFAELLGRVRETAVDAFSHGELPFEKVLEELLPGIRAGFHLRDTPRLSLKLDGLQVERFETDHGTTYLPLMLYMSEGDDGLTARLDYDADLFEVATVTRMLENLRALLESVVADPEQRISKLPLPIKAGGGRRARFGKQLRRAVRRVRRVAGRRLRQSRPR